MSISRILGIILLAIGLVCLYFGFNSSGAPIDQVVGAATGRFTQSTMWYIVGGVMMSVGGAALFIGGRPKL